jgi:hypothetical protein
MPYSKKYITNYSRFLVGLAWTVEIIAVLIGLTISIVVSVSAYASFSSGGNANLLDSTSAVVVAGLPFVLVAVVELCKIPLTFAFMIVRHVAWRALFLLFVVFLCLITFETMLNGFERNFSNLNRAIDERKNDIESMNSEIALLEKRRDNIEKFTEDELLSEVDNSRAEIDGEYRQIVQRIDQNTGRVLSEIDYGFKDELEAEITRLANVRDDYYRDWRAETMAVEDRMSTMLIANISGSSDERDRLLAELEALKAEMAQSMATANFFTRAGRERKYRELIRDKEDQLGKITTGYLGGDAIEKQASMESQLKQQLEFVNTKYARRVDDVTARIEGLKTEIASRLERNAQLKSSVVSKSATDKIRFSRIRSEQSQELDQYLSTKIVELEQISDRSFGIDEQNFQLQNQQRVLQTEIGHLIDQNQIYRLAMYAFGKESSSEVERGMIGIVAFIWFGSLSLISSVCGVMLALAGFYLRRYGEPEAEDGDPGAVAHIDAEAEL